ncbi:MAG: hypothetical protein Q8P67_26415 [archaeon]|nr:hypothetical protein [archaeon]
MRCSTCFQNSTGTSTFCCCSKSSVWANLEGSISSSLVTGPRPLPCLWEEGLPCLCGVSLEDPPVPLRGGSDQPPALDRSDRGAFSRSQGTRNMTPRSQLGLNPRAFFRYHLTTANQQARDVGPHDWTNMWSGNSGP